MKKIKLKTVVIGLTIVAITTTIVLTSGILSKTSLINVAGSSAVQPLMVSFSNKYNDADLVTQAGGSGAGIRAIIDDTKEIGMASKSPNIIGGTNKEDEQSWIDKKIKTVTIAWDGMGIIYKPKNKNSKTIDININTILNLYKAFAGNKQLTFSDLDIDDNDSNTIIHPYARNGGSVVSGTADAFYKDSHLDYVHTEEEQEELDEALIEGRYGKFTTTTAESNSQSWSFIKNENKIGSMIYLSAGFIINNKKEIKDNGFKIATYNGVNLEFGTISKKYEWYRPLNLMLSIIKTNDKIGPPETGKLINWILDNHTAAEIIKNGGYIKLDEPEIIERMCIDGKLNTFWTTDDKMYFDHKNQKSEINNGK